MAVAQLQAFIRHLRSMMHAQDSGGLTDAELLQRFVTLRDQAGFEVLLWRHGPTVLSVCRRLLHNEEDIEDTFQATFLALARKAGSIAKRDAVGSWLYKVAYRIALDARRLSANLAATERRVPNLAAVESGEDIPQEIARRELHSLVDAEIQRLPRKYRDPVVLCHLEGKTQDEAARELGWAKGTVSTRLIRARELLRRRLHRHGDAFSATTLLPPLAMRALPSNLAKTTLRAVLLVQSSTAAGRLISGRALALAEGALQALAVGHWKATAALLLVLASLGAGAGWFAYQATQASPAADDSGQVSPQKQPAGRSADEESSSVLGKLDPSRIPPEDRFAWQPPELVAVLGEHRGRSWGSLSDAAFSPDGKWIASCGEDLIVRLWDARTLRESVALRHPSQAVRCVAFSPDGKTLASGAGRNTSGIDERTLVLWDLTVTPPRTRVVLNLPERFFTFAFSPDGSTLACGGLKGIRLFKISATGEPEPLSLLPQVVTQSLAFSGNGKTLASAGFDGSLVLWDVPRATQKMVLRSTILKYAWSIALSRDGKTLAQCGDNSNGHPYPVVLWDLNNPNHPREKELPGKPTAQVTFMKLSPDRKMLATGNANGELGLWNLAGAEPTERSIEENGTWNRPLDFSPDGKTLLVRHDNGILTLWDLTGSVPKDRFEHKGHTGGVQRIALARTGLLASEASDGTLRLWDLSGAQAKERFSFKLQWALYHGRFALSRDGKTLAFDNGDGSLQIWDLGNAKPRKRFQWSLPHVQGRSEGFNLLEMSPNGKVLVSGGRDDLIRFWDLTTDPPRERKRMEGYATTDRVVVGRTSATVAYDPPKSAGVASPLWQSGPILRIWDSTGTKPRREGLVRTLGLAFIPDSRGLIVGASRREIPTGAPPRDEVWLWRRHTDEGPQPRQVRLEDSESMTTGTGSNRGRRNGRTPFDQPRDTILSGACSPDGQTLASAAKDGKLILWELATGGKYRQWQLPGAIDSLVFADDGRHLITANANGTLYVLRFGHGVQAPTDFSVLWETLASREAAKAYPAIWSLVANPRRTLPLIKERLERVKVGKAEEIERLIDQLNHAQFKERQKATAALDELRQQAEPALRRKLAEQPPTLELRRRIEGLLENWKVLSPDQLRRLRVIQILEQIGNPDAQQLLKRLAEGAPQAPETQHAQAALKRLAERSASPP